ELPSKITTNLADLTTITMSLVHRWFVASQDENKALKLIEQNDLIYLSEATDGWGLLGFPKQSIIDWLKDSGWLYEISPSMDGSVAPDSHINIRRVLESVNEDMVESLMQAIFTDRSFGQDIEELHQWIHEFLKENLPKPFPHFVLLATSHLQLQKAILQNPDDDDIELQEALSSALAHPDSIITILIKYWLAENQAWSTPVLLREENGGVCFFDEGGDILSHPAESWGFPLDLTCELLQEMGQQFQFVNSLASTEISVIKNTATELSEESLKKSDIETLSLKELKLLHEKLCRENPQIHPGISLGNNNKSHKMTWVNAIQIIYSRIERKSDSNLAQVEINTSKTLVDADGSTEIRAIVDESISVGELNEIVADYHLTFADQGTKTLFLILKKQWFDLIKAGEKREEYREICPYWEKRLEGKTYDHVTFQLGYSGEQRVTLPLLGIKKGYPVKEWSPESWWNKECFILELGRSDAAIEFNRQAEAKLAKLAEELNTKELQRQAEISEKLKSLTNSDGKKELAYVVRCQNTHGSASPFDAIQEMLKELNNTLCDWLSDLPPENNWEAFKAHLYSDPHTYPIVLAFYYGEENLLSNWEEIARSRLVPLAKMFKKWNAVGDKYDRAIDKLLPSMKELFVAELIQEWDERTANGEEPIINLSEMEDFATQVADRYLPFSEIAEFTGANCFGEIQDILQWLDTELWNIWSEIDDCDDQAAVSRQAKVEKIAKIALRKKVVWPRFFNKASFVEALIKAWDEKVIVVDLGIINEFTKAIVTPFLPPDQDVEVWMDNQKWSLVLDAFDWYDCAKDDLENADEDDDDIEGIETIEIIAAKLREMLTEMFDFEATYQEMDALYAKSPK
ncbi:MAG: hypothetical protein ACRCT1_07405, partial [Microcoleaceae cyanobacterium]